MNKKQVSALDDLSPDLGEEFDAVAGEYCVTVLHQS